MKFSLQLVGMVSAAILLLVCWPAWAVLSPQITSWFVGAANDSQLERANNWGGSFGAFNAFVSTAGFIVLLWTVRLQGRALRDQAADLHRQRFESSFFELMRLMRELKAEVSFRHSTEYRATRQRSVKSILDGSKQNSDLKSPRGASAIRAANLEFIYWLKASEAGPQPSQALLTEIYMNRIHERSEWRLAPYFRIIFNILNRISDDKVLTDDEKVKYANLLRGQLTSYEISLLALNGLSPVSGDLMRLIKKFKMLKYMTNIAMKRRLLPIYGENAFSPRSAG